MNKETFDDNIMNEIHKKQMRPRSRWFFVTEQWFFVTLISITTFIGSLAVTSILFILTDHDWFAVEYLDEGLVIHIVKTIPYLWLGILLIVVLVISKNVKKIGHGYRYSFWRIVYSSLFASISVGVALYFAGTGTLLDNYFDRTIPSYHSLVSSNNDIWIYPEDGLLSGKIQTTTKTSFTIIDVDDQPWTITINEKTIVETPLLPGKKVKITGTMIDGSTFTATAVLPWRNERK